MTEVLAGRTEACAEIREKIRGTTAGLVGRSRHEALGPGLTPRAIADRMGNERLGKALAQRGSFCTGTRSDRHADQPADRPACARAARRHRWSGVATD